MFSPDETFIDPEVTETRYENYGGFGRYRTNVYDGLGSLPLTPWIPGLGDQRYTLPNPFAPNPAGDDAQADAYRTKCEVCIVTQWRNIGRWFRNPFGILVLVVKAIPVYSCQRRKECRDRERDKDRSQGLPPEPKIPSGWGLQVRWGWWIRCIETIEYWADDPLSGGGRGPVKTIRRKYTYGGGLHPTIDSDNFTPSNGRIPLESANGVVLDTGWGIEQSDRDPSIGNAKGYNGLAGAYQHRRQLMDLPLIAVAEYIHNPVILQRYPAYRYPSLDPSPDNGYASIEFNNTHRAYAQSGRTFWDDVKFAFQELRRRKFRDSRNQEYDLYTDWFRPQGVPYLFGVGNWRGYSMYWTIYDIKLLPPEGAAIPPKKDNGLSNPNEDDDMQCCEEQTDLLRAIYKRLGCDQYPVTVPETLAPSDDKEKGKTRTIEDLTALAVWQAEQMDALVGEFPIEIKINSDDGSMGSGAIEYLKFPNIAEALAEITGMLIPNTSDNSIAIDLINRNLTETIAAKNAAIVGQDIAFANSEYLGYKIKQISREVESSVTIDKRDDYDEFVKPGKYKIQSWANADKNTAQAFFTRLMFAASIIKEVFYMPAAKDKDGKRMRKTFKDILGDTKEVANEWKEFLGDPLDQGKNAKDKPKIIDKSKTGRVFDGDGFGSGLGSDGDDKGGA